MLYHPSGSAWDNIVRCSQQVEKLYIVDNSDRNESFYEHVGLPGNVEFIFRGENIGIARALNLGAYRAIENGASYLLTMDQDSVIEDGHVVKMRDVLSLDSRIGLISPYIVHERNPRASQNSGVEKIVTAMTSGSVLNLDAFRKAGPFVEKLFIDYVDIEYCLRLQQNGFSVMQLNSVLLLHNLGAVEKRKLFFMSVFPTNHSALRLYYRTRNRCYVHAKFRREFPKYISNDRLNFVKELLKIMLFEQHKIQKLKMIFRGYLDFRRNKFGAFV